MPEHTKGPWSYEGQSDTTGAYLVTNEWGEIAQVFDPENDMAECATNPVSDANARLIAAAPAMLEALTAAQADLQGIMPEFEPSGDRDHSGWKTLAEIEQVLSAARGDTPTSVATAADPIEGMKEPHTDLQAMTEAEALLMELRAHDLDDDTSQQTMRELAKAIERNGGESMQ